MSKLDEQLKELQIKKLKVEFLKLLRNNIGDVTGDQFKEIEVEVKEEVFAFLDAQIDMIESGEIKTTNEVTQLFNDDEVNALKLFAQKAISKQNQPIKQSPSVNNIENNNFSTQDKIRFAQEHRHLGGKMVKLKDGNEGKVVGLDAPSVLISLYNGVTVGYNVKDIVSEVKNG